MGKLIHLFKKQKTKWIGLDQKQGFKQVSTNKCKVTHQGVTLGAVLVF